MQRVYQLGVYHHREAHLVLLVGQRKLHQVVNRIQSGPREVDRHLTEVKVFLLEKLQEWFAEVVAAGGFIFIDQESLVIDNKFYNLGVAHEIFVGVPRNKAGTCRCFPCTA